MDSRRRTVLLTFVVGYFFVVAVVLFLIPRLGTQTIYEGLAVWVFVVLALALIVVRRRRKPEATAPKPGSQKRQHVPPEVTRS